MKYALPITLFLFVLFYPYIDYRLNRGYYKDSHVRDSISNHLILQEQESALQDFIIHELSLYASRLGVIQQEQLRMFSAKRMDAAQLIQDSVNYYFGASEELFKLRKYISK